MEIEPKKLILIASIIALDIADNKSINEINTYKNLFSTIASNLQSYVNQSLFNKKEKWLPAHSFFTFLHKKYQSIVADIF